MTNSFIIDKPPIKRHFRASAVILQYVGGEAMPVLERGLIHVYTGDGKGKTTCALGAALRMAGHGGKVAIVQFLKGWSFYGEIAGLSYLPNVRLERTGRAEFVDKRAPLLDDFAEAERGLTLAEGFLVSGSFDMVIMDEINVAIDYGLISARSVVGALRRRQPWVEAILTGRNAPSELVALADVVTEMREIKHPFKKGLASRMGVDF
jgi:cob(I)alamin adenosyltransferase